MVVFSALSKNEREKAAYAGLFGQSAERPLADGVWRVNRANVRLFDPRFADDIDCESFGCFDVRRRVFVHSQTRLARAGDGNGRRIVSHGVEPTNASISDIELCKRVLYLKGATFSTPVSDTVETNATGRGTMPLIMSW